jgi:multimeric flavodoxin WrbA
MKISVINGSPKHEASSVTMHYIKYLQKKLPQAEFVILNVGSSITTLEKNHSLFEEFISTIRQSDGVIWGFPLYYLLVSSQLKRFIELVSERGQEAAFKSKPAAAIVTSIHFCDNYALNYIREISEDLGMNFFDHYTADMMDLTRKDERERLTRFGSNFINFILSGKVNPRQSIPLEEKPLKLDLTAVAVNAIRTDKKAVILTDEREGNNNLRQMTDLLRKNLGPGADLLNLHDIRINGGCQGCIRCGYDFNCIYDNHDDYRRFYLEKVVTADIIIYAGSIRDRYLSSRWKQFFDRSFFHNHTPLLSGKQVGMVISGPFRQMDNLKNLFQNYFEVQNTNLVGIVSDDRPDPADVITGLQNLAERLVSCSEQGYVAPRSFLGIGGTKIFRDDVYSRLRFPFVGDYRSYKKLGKFDFPQKDWKTLLMNRFLVLLSALPKLRRLIYTRGMEIGVIRSFRNLVDQAGPTNE